MWQKYHRLIRHRGSALCNSAKKTCHASPHPTNEKLKTTNEIFQITYVTFKSPTRKLLSYSSRRVFDTRSLHFYVTLHPALILRIFALCLAKLHHFLICTLSHFQFNAPLAGCVLLRWTPLFLMGKSLLIYVSFIYANIFRNATRA
jgi:hypothetical protein